VTVSTVRPTIECGTCFGGSSQTELGQVTSVAKQLDPSTQSNGSESND
jgi:hypothetical protein